MIPERSQKVGGIGGSVADLKIGKSFPQGLSLGKTEAERKKIVRVKAGCGCRAILKVFFQANERRWRALDP